MQVEAGVLGQPRFDCRVLMGGVIVGDQVEGERLGPAAVDRPQETQPFLVAMPLHALPDHLPLATSSAANKVVVPWRL